MSQRIQTLDEQRIRAFLERESVVSETAGSLARKLRLNMYVVQHVLDRCAAAGELSCQRFDEGEDPVYYRSARWFEARAS
jgi:hypothetical protein